MNNEEVRYSVVIPVYNESKNLCELYRRVTSVFKQIGGQYELIFINDGSTDDSFQRLKEFALADSSVVVISFSRNFGQHRAVVAGFDEAAGELVVTLDADLQNPPEEIPILLDAMNQGFDMASG